jgi:hypothetical protein
MMEDSNRECLGKAGSGSNAVICQAQDVLEIIALGEG